MPGAMARSLRREQGYVPLSTLRSLHHAAQAAPTLHRALALPHALAPSLLVFSAVARKPSDSRSKAPVYLVTGIPPCSHLILQPISNHQLSRQSNSETRKLNTSQATTKRISTSDKGRQRNLREPSRSISITSHNSHHQSFLPIGDDSLPTNQIQLSHHLQSSISHSSPNRPAL
jgi:hypothetical protein